jgi:ribosomal protein S18 acetylase RimI-like enzyme
MKTLVIRQAFPLDEPLVFRMAEAFHREDGHPLAPTGPEAIRSLLKGSPLGAIYLLEEEGAALGYFALCFTMSLEFGGLVVILDDLYVLPEARGRGIGSQVLAKVEAVAAGRAAVQIFLEVEKANERAFGFYQRNGWRRRDRHMMEKML